MSSPSSPSLLSLSLPFRKLKSFGSVSNINSIDSNDNNTVITNLSISTISGRQSRPVSLTKKVSFSSVVTVLQSVSDDDLNNSNYNYSTDSYDMNIFPDKSLTYQSITNDDLSINIPRSNSPSINQTSNSPAYLSTPLTISPSNSPVNLSPNLSPNSSSNQSIGSSSGLTFSTSPSNSPSNSLKVPTKSKNKLKHKVNKSNKQANHEISCVNYEISTNCFIC